MAILKENSSAFSDTWRLWQWSKLNLAQDQCSPLSCTKPHMHELKNIKWGLLWKKKSQKLACFQLLKRIQYTRIWLRNHEIQLHIYMEDWWDCVFINYHHKVTKQTRTEGIGTKLHIKNRLVIIYSGYIFKIYTEKTLCPKWEIFYNNKSSLLIFCWLFIKQSASGSPLILRVEYYFEEGKKE